MTTRKKTVAGLKPTSDGGVKFEGMEEDYRCEISWHQDCKCEGKPEIPDKDYSSYENLPVPVPFEKQPIATNQATTTDSTTGLIRHDSPNRLDKTNFPAGLNEVLKPCQLFKDGNRENRESRQVPSQAIGPYVKFDKRCIPEKHPVEQVHVLKKYPPEQSDVSRRYLPEQFEKKTPEQPDVSEKHPLEQHGQQTEDNLTRLSRECRYFFDEVTQLHVIVKQTREKYENDETLMALLYKEEKVMFLYLESTEYTLNSFVGHLEYVMYDYVKIVKLVNKWLKENYFEAIDCYYLNSDIQQSLVLHVKENRPIFHEVLKEKNSQTGHYSFDDLEAGLEKPKKWYHMLYYHLRRMDEAHKRCFSVAVQFNVVQFETFKLLEEKQTYLVERKKQHANHPLAIITTLENMNPFDNQSEYAPEDIYPPDYCISPKKVSDEMLLPRRQLPTQHQYNDEHPPERFDVHIDSAYPAVVTEPYSHIADNTGANCVANDKNIQEKVSFKKLFSGAKSVLKRKPKCNLPTVKRVDTQADIDESSSLPHNLDGSIQREAESTQEVLKEAIDYASNNLKDLRSVESRYVKNVALLDTKTGILQEGEYRRLFERIPAVINNLSRLLDALQKCDQNDFITCQLLLDAVEDEVFKVFKDYRVNFRFQEFTLSYLRKRRLAFRQIEKSLETSAESLSSPSHRRKLLTLDVLLKQPCYFIFNFKRLFQRLKKVIEKTNDRESVVVRLVHDLVRNMNTISDECEDEDLELEEKEERHACKILLRIEFESEIDISNEENDISNESWVKTWDCVIVFSCKKAGSKDWKKVGLDVKLVTFQRLVMFIDVKRHQTDEQNYVYKLIDCANKNFVEVVKPSSSTIPFKVPVRRGVALNVFLVVMQKGSSVKTKSMYYVCWERSRVGLRNFEFWRKNLTVPTDDGNGNASWNRVRAQKHSDNTQGDNIRHMQRVQTDGHSRHSVILKEKLKQPLKK